nr:PREDICTED: mitochondrial import receptor subunit TOM20 homolog [Anolis carolinensis]|eukprot:XP_016852752.1 PREDICTED: mitochondrial import receptor subunit TOM20 homolog [Anolis carolinensis]
MWPGRAGLWLVLGVCGLALLVYCLYFDRKRRGQPDFKRRLRESKENGGGRLSLSRPIGLLRHWSSLYFTQFWIYYIFVVYSFSRFRLFLTLWTLIFHFTLIGRRKENEKAKERDAKVCKLNDTVKLQDFFLQEIQLAELWLGKGEPKKSTEHLANAISVCTHPNQLLQVLEQTLPPQVFEMLLQSIPHAVQRLETALNEQD